VIGCRGALAYPGDTGGRPALVVRSRLRRGVQRDRRLIHGMAAHANCRRETDQGISMLAGVAWTM
jgi:hypothetical protein